MVQTSSVYLGKQLLGAPSPKNAAAPRQALLEERENVVSLGILPCSPISAAFSPHGGLVAVSWWAGQQQQHAVGGCAALVVLQGWNCHPWRAGRG